MQRATRRSTARARPRPRKLTHAADAQTQILAAVDELFYREGARAVGVEAVVKRAGVNKMALYRQFGSKEGLLLHYLRRMDEVFWGYFERGLAQHPGKPREQLVQFFSDLAQRAVRPGYRGCPFVNIAAEFPDPTHPARVLVAEKKAQMEERLLELTTAAQVRDPQLLASALALLVEGTYAASQTFSDHTSIRVLPDIVRQMIDTG